MRKKKKDENGKIEIDKKHIQEINRTNYRKGKWT
jgi:hypothetical protein